MKTIIGLMAWLFVVAAFAALAAVTVGTWSFVYSHVRVLF